MKRFFAYQSLKYRRSAGALFLAIAVAMLSMMSCSKTVHCTQMGPKLAFIGFDTSELKEALLVSFADDGSFAAVLDSQRVSLAYGESNDTLDGPKLEQGRDYRVTVFPAGRAWKISDVRYQDNTKEIAVDKDYFMQCSLSSYAVDGKEANYPPTVNQLYTTVHLHR